MVLRILVSDAQLEDGTLTHVCLIGVHHCILFTFFFLETGLWKAHFINADLE